MPTYLLTWNPVHWHWANYNRLVTQIRKTGSAPQRWNTGHTWKIVAGDRVFLLKQGMGVRGIVGSGTVVGSVYPMPHFIEARRLKGEIAPRVDCQLDALIDLRKFLPLETADLEDALPQVHWRPRASGMLVPAPAATKLERLWRRYLQQPAPFFPVAGELARRGRG